MAFDIHREDWRTFRLDRMHNVKATTWRCQAREHPDPVQYVQQSITSSPYRYVARIRLHAPAGEVRRRVPPRMARVEDDVDGWSLVTAGADDLYWLALHIAELDLETEILEPPELRDVAAGLARRMMTW